MRDCLYYLVLGGAIGWLAATGFWLVLWLATELVDNDILDCIFF